MFCMIGQPFERMSHRVKSLVLFFWAGQGLASLQDSMISNCWGRRGGDSQFTRFDDFKLGEVAGQPVYKIR